MADSMQPLKVAQWHELLAAYMIANPSATLADLSRHFKVSPSYISIIRNSDAFKTYWAQRMDKVFDGSVDQILNKTAAMTEMALDAINNKLQKQADFMSVPELEHVAETGLKRLGYGINKSPTGPSVNVSVGISVDRSDLERARQAMLQKSGVTSVNQLPAPEVTPSLPAEGRSSEVLEAEVIPDG